jgi:hypothetical protein
MIEKMKISQLEHYDSFRFFWKICLERQARAVRSFLKMISLFVETSPALLLALSQSQWKHRFHFIQMLSRQASGIDPNQELNHDRYLLHQLQTVTHTHTH